MGFVVLFSVEESLEKKSFLFKERDEGKRQEFLSRLESIPFEKWVWVDECGVNEEVEHPYGRAPRGKRVYDEKSGKIRHSRTTVIATYRQKRMKAPFRFKGHNHNTAVFHTWVEACLVPVLEEEDWVILDNGAFHKSPQTRKAIEEKGAHVLLLSPWSEPRLNRTGNSAYFEPFLPYT